MEPLSNKLCDCGCGQFTRMNRDTHLPQRYVNGHNPKPGGGHPATLRKGNYAEYSAYSAAKFRCTNPDAQAWAEYGGRGIRFLFTSFEHWLAELGPRPAGVDAKGRALYSVDRINNDGNYEPGNVRWATSEDQYANKRYRNKYSKAEELLEA